MNQGQLASEQFDIKSAERSDQQKQLELTRMKWRATGLLALCTVLFVASAYWCSAYPSLGYVKAFAEAGIVGALADWFAVVALFRRPLGLPIPHTALIPASKHRIADNLGDFIKSNFLSPSRVTAQIQSFNLANRVATFLSSRESAQTIAGYITQVFSNVLKAINHAQVTEFIHQGLAMQLRKIDLTQSAAGVLDILMRDEAHMQLLDLGIEEIDKLLQNDDTRDILLQRVIASMGKLSMLDPGDWAANKLATKILDGAVQMVHEVRRDKKHTFRQGFDHKLKLWVEQLRKDPALKYKANQLRDHLLQSKEVSSYVQHLWKDLSEWVLKDLASSQSLIQNHLIDILSDLGTRLDQDTSLKQLINQKIESMVPDLLLRYRDSIGIFISDQIKEWDDVYLVKRLELNVGKDLQFIRISGTLVGGFVGLLLYTMTRMIG